MKSLVDNEIDLEEFLKECRGIEREDFEDGSLRSLLKLFALKSLKEEDKPIKSGENTPLAKETEGKFEPDFQAGEKVFYVNVPEEEEKISDLRKKIEKYKDIASKVSLEVSIILTGLELFRSYRELKRLKEEAEKENIPVRFKIPSLKKEELVDLEEFEEELRI